MAKNPNYDVPLRGTESTAEWDGRSGEMIANYLNDKVGAFRVVSGFIYGFRSEAAADDWETGGSQDNSPLILTKTTVTESPVYLFYFDSTSKVTEKEDIWEINYSLLAKLRNPGQSAIDDDPNVTFSYQVKYGNQDWGSETGIMQIRANTENKLEIKKPTNPGNYKIKLIAKANVTVEGITTQRTASIELSATVTNLILTLTITSNNVEYTENYNKVFTKEDIFNLYSSDNTLKAKLNNTELSSFALNKSAFIEGVNTIGMYREQVLLKQWQFIYSANNDLTGDYIALNDISYTLTNYSVNKLFSWFKIGTNSHSVTLGTDNTLGIIASDSGTLELFLLLDDDITTGTIHIGNITQYDVAVISNALLHPSELKHNLFYDIFSSWSIFSNGDINNIEGFCGRQRDDNFLVPRGNTATSTYKPLAISSAKPNSICEIEFKTDYVVNEELPIITIGDPTTDYCVNLGAGFGYIGRSINAGYNDFYYTSDTPVTIAIKTEEISKLRSGTTTNELLFTIFIDGCIHRAFPISLPGSATDGGIAVDTSAAELKVKYLRYDNDFQVKDEDVLRDYLIFNPTATTNEDKIASINKHFDNILSYNTTTDEYDVAFNKVLTHGYNVLVWKGTMPYLGAGSDGTGTLDIYYNGGRQEGTIIEPSLSKAGTISGQGTSSKNYYKWNQKFVPTDGEAWCFGDHEEEKAVQYTWKVNWASSMQSHKMGAVNMYNELHKKLNISTPLNGRVTVWQEPFLLFHQPTGSETPVFYAMVTFGPHKGDEKIWGIESNTKILLLEGCDNPTSNEPDESDVPLVTLNVDSVSWEDDKKYYKKDGTEVAGLSSSGVKYIGTASKKNQWEVSFNKNSPSITPFDDAFDWVQNDETEFDLDDVFNKDDLLFTMSFLKLIAASDNRAKNTYLYSVDDGKINFLQDDLDTIFSTDNRGRADKPFWIEEHDILQNSKSTEAHYTSTDLYNSMPLEAVWKGQNNALYNKVETTCEAELKDMMARILTTLSNEYGTVFNAFQHFFFNTQENAFPISLYNKVTRLFYIEAYITGNTNADGTEAETIAQATGNLLRKERDWVTKRLIYIGSYANKSKDFTGSTSMRNSSEYSTLGTPLQGSDLYIVGVDSSIAAGLICKTKYPSYIHWSNQISNSYSDYTPNSSEKSNAYSSNRVKGNIELTLSEMTGGTSQNVMLPVYWFSELANVSVLPSGTDIRVNTITKVSDSTTSSLSKKITISSKGIEEVNLGKAFNEVELLTNAKYIKNVYLQNSEIDKIELVKTASTPALEKLQLPDSCEEVIIHGIYGTLENSSDIQMAPSRIVIEENYTGALKTYIDTLISGNSNPITNLNITDTLNDIYVTSTYLSKLASIDDVTFKVRMYNNEYSPSTFIKFKTIQWGVSEFRHQVNSNKNVLLVGRKHHIQNGTEYTLNGDYNNFSYYSLNNLNNKLRSILNSPPSIGITLNDDYVIDVDVNNNFIPSIMDKVYASGYIDSNADITTEGGITGIIFNMNTSNGIAYVVKDNMPLTTVSFGRIGKHVNNDSTFYDDTATANAISAVFGNSASNFNSLYNNNTKPTNYTDSQAIGGGEALTKVLLSTRNTALSYLNISISDSEHPNIDTLRGYISQYTASWSLVSCILYEAASLCDNLEPLPNGNARWWLPNNAELDAIYKVSDLRGKLTPYIWSSSLGTRGTVSSYYARQYSYSYTNTNGLVPPDATSYPVSSGGGGRNNYVLAVTSINYRGN